MSPYLLLGFFIAGLLFLIFPKRKVKQYMGREKRGAVINASLLGIPLPLCSCGVIPTGISFYKNGASKGSTVSFLISTPQTGIDSVLVTYSLLGLPFALLRPVIALITGIAGGFITDKVDSETPGENSVSDQHNNLPAGFFPKLKAMFRYAFVEFLQDISAWLMAGLAIAALISVIIPDDFFTSLTSDNFLELVIILIAAIPVYICATASVPIAAVLMLKGLSPGAALVLLMAGPATNAATITMIARVLGKKSLIAYLGSIITGALLFGTLINNFMPPEWFDLSGIYNLEGHSHHLIPAWIRYSSAIILLVLIINGYIQKRKPQNVIKTSQYKFTEMNNQTIIKVSGMTCNHCKESVENSIESVKGVKTAVADISSGNVIIDGTGFNLTAIAEKIEAMGYKFKK